MSEAAKAGGYRMMVFFNTVDLAVAFQKRNGKTDPPDCDEEKSNSHGRFHRKSQCLIEESQRKAGEKWNTASDIAPGVSAGRHFIHTFFGRDISEHRVIEDQTQRVCRLCQDKDQEKPDP